MKENPLDPLKASNRPLCVCVCVCAINWPAYVNILPSQAITFLYFSIILKWRSYELIGNKFSTRQVAKFCTVSHRFKKSNIMTIKQAAWGRTLFHEDALGLSALRYSYL